MSRWGVLAAGFALLILGGGLLAIAVLIPESLVVLFGAGLFGMILCFVGIGALAAGIWIAARAGDAGTET